MSTAILSIDRSRAAQAARLSAKLRKLRPALREVRFLLAAQFASAAECGHQDELRELGSELLAFDRWQSFELGRIENSGKLERTA